MDRQSHKARDHGGREEGSSADWALAHRHHLTGGLVSTASFAKAHMAAFAVCNFDTSSVTYNAHFPFRTGCRNGLPGRPCLLHGWRNGRPGLHFFVLRFRLWYVRCT